MLLYISKRPTRIYIAFEKKNFWSTHQSHCRHWELSCCDPCFTFGYFSSRKFTTERKRFCHYTCISQHLHMLPSTTTCLLTVFLLFQSARWHHVTTVTQAHYFSAGSFQSNQHNLTKPMQLNTTHATQCYTMQLTQLGQFIQVNASKHD